MKTLIVADGPTHRMQELLKSYRLAQIAVDGQSGPRNERGDGRGPGCLIRGWHKNYYAFGAL